MGARVGQMGLFSWWGGWRPNRQTAAGWPAARRAKDLLPAPARDGSHQAEPVSILYILVLVS
jgi:hypothetical protein